MTTNIQTGWLVGPGWSFGINFSSPYGVYMWGGNSYGQLGLGNQQQYISTPVQLGSLSSWSQITCGYAHTHFLQSNGTLWSCGYQYNNGGTLWGALGLNTSVNYSSPVQVGALSTWTFVFAGNNYFSAGSQSNGTLWMWGNGLYGQLGQGNTASTSSPVQVGALTNWSKNFSCGYGAIAAIKQDGTLWTWGRNFSGALGLGDRTNRSSPVQVGSASNWVQVSLNGGTLGALGAIQSNGTLWTCGYNNSGQLGQGDITTRSTPTQVGTLSNWAKVVVGFYHMCALQSNGTLWVWGGNSYGQLGNNSLNYTSSPVQVGAVSNWSNIACGYNFTIGIQAGSLYAWGQDTYYQLGLGTNTGYSSPVQVGNLSTWILSNNLGAYSGFALHS